MKKEFKYPCAVETNELTEEQGNTLREAFIRLGAGLCDAYNFWNYYGVDYTGDINGFAHLENFAEKDDDEVTLFTYEEIMSFVAELEQPKEAPVAKKELKFPCAIAMSEITSREVYEKVFNAFIEAGARDRENYNDPDDLGCQYEYFGVNSNQETIHWNNLEDYDADDCSNGYVAIYSLEDILGDVDNKEPILYDFSLIGKEVLFIPSSKRYLIEGVDIGDETITIGSDKDSGEIVCKLADVVFIDQQEALSEPLGDVLADTPSVGIDEVVELTTGASVKIEFTICVGGVAHKGSRDEAFKIYQDLQSIFEKEVV